MAKLTKKQRKFLKTIENPKDKKYQKQQFKLQNKFDKFGLGEEIIFIDGIFKTDNPELIAFFNECPMVGKVGESNVTKETWYGKTIEEIKEKSEQALKNFLNVNVTNLGFNTKTGDKTIIEREIDIENPFSATQKIIDRVKIIESEGTIHFFTTPFVPKLDINSLTKESLRDLTEPKRNHSLGEIALEKISKTPDEPKHLDFDLHKKEYTIEDMEKCFNEGRRLNPMNGIKRLFLYSDFKKYKITLK